MIPALLVLIGCALHLLAGVMAWRGGATMPTRAVVLALLASLCLGVAGVVALAVPSAEFLRFPWPVPGGGGAIGVDALSAVFLLPIAVLGAAVTVYARSYWDAQPSGPRTRFAVSALLAGMALVVTARHGLWFLLCWEAMAMAAWLALNAEHRRDEVRTAGWIYLIFARVGTVCLIAMVALVGLRSGSLLWEPLSGPAQTLDSAIVVLAIVGFGAKAGLLPMHVWLPGAHANAPSHVSALLSGVTLKTGMYGILRITGLLPEPAAWWGGLLLAIGAVTALYGIASALAQTDYKRLLACSSIENVGFIAMAIGLALMARAHGRMDLALLAGTAALLHVWHHAVFKGLLFLTAGSVLHATRTRTMDRLGGVLTRMPLTGALCLLGCATAAGLPGLAGFASEWPLYCAAFADLRGGNWAGIVAVLVLALCGGLALAAYGSLVGGVLLGSPRSADVQRAHDPQATMRGPMIALAVACVALPLAVPWTASALTPALGPVLRTNADASITIPGLGWLAALGGTLLVMGAGLWWRLRRRLALTPTAAAGTWDCGYADPTVRMQYTQASFTALLGRELAPQPIPPATVIEPATGLFPQRARIITTAGDGVLDRCLRPLAGRFVRVCLRLRALHQGNLHAYLLYVFLAIVALLLGALVGEG